MPHKPGESVRQRLEVEGQAIFADDLMQRAAPYVARGRAHAALTTAEIKDRWTAAFKSMVYEFTEARSRHMEDYLVELSLRGELPPYDRVQKEWKLLNQVLAGADGDPEFQESVNAAINEYRSRRDKPTN